MPRKLILDVDPGADDAVATVVTAKRSSSSSEQCAALRAPKTPAGGAAADFIEYRIRGYEANQPTGTPDTALVNDAVCVAALIDATIIQTCRVNVVVETKGEYTIGRAVVDHERRTQRSPTCHVAFHADRTAFFELMIKTFGKSSKT
jgi:inosine-uridine nucleoside N-ribohydrolase